MHAIFVWFDRLPYGVLGCCGNTESGTSGFDRWAAGCVTFDHCFAADLEHAGPHLIAEVICAIAAGGTDVQVLGEGDTVLSRHLQSLPEANTIHFANTDGPLDDRMLDLLEAGIANRQLSVLSLRGVPPNAGDQQSDAVCDAVQHADALLNCLADQCAGLRNEAMLFLISAAEGPGTRREAETAPVAELQERRVHVPLFGRIGPPLEYGERCRRLVTTSDAAGTLAAYFATEMPPREHTQNLLTAFEGQDFEGRDAVTIRGRAGVRGVRTSDWYLICQLSDAGGEELLAQAAESAVLFAKPEDMWDQLDVARQWPDLVRQLVKRIIDSETEAGDLPENLPINRVDID